MPTRDSWDKWCGTPGPGMRPPKGTPPQAWVRPDPWLRPEKLPWETLDPLYDVGNCDAGLHIFQTVSIGSCHHHYKDPIGLGHRHLTKCRQCLKHQESYVRLRGCAQCEPGPDWLPILRASSNQLIADHSWSKPLLSSTHVSGKGHEWVESCNSCRATKSTNDWTRFAGCPRCHPAPPAIIEPAEGAGILTGSSIFVTWRAADGASSYNMTVEDRNSNTAVYSAAGILVEQHAIPRRVLVSGFEYRISVRTVTDIAGVPAETCTAVRNFRLL